MCSDVMCNNYTTYFEEFNGFKPTSSETNDNANNNDNDNDSEHNNDDNDNDDDQNANNDHEVSFVQKLEMSTFNHSEILSSCVSEFRRFRNSWFPLLISVGGFKHFGSSGSNDASYTSAQAA